MITQSQWLSWEEIIQKGEIYTPRTGHAVVSMNNSIYLFGGIDEADRQNDLFQFRIEDNTWFRLKMSGTIPSARSGSVGVYSQQSLYFFGGYTRKHGEYYNDLYKFTPQTCIWTKLNAKNPPQARIDHSLCRYPNNLNSPKNQKSNTIFLLFGGSNGFKKYNDIQEYYVEKQEWKKIQIDGLQPSKRFGHSAIIFNDLMYIFGGWDGTNTLNDIWLYSIIQKKWILIEASNPPAGRYRHSTVTHNKCMYIFGGVDQSQERFGDLFEFAFQTNTWRRIVIQSQGPTPRSFHKCSYESGYMYIIGGYDGQRKNDLFKINLELVQIYSDEQNLKILTERQQIEKHQPEYVMQCLLSLTTPEQSFKEYQTLTNKLSVQKKGQNMLQVFQMFPSRRWFYIDQSQESVYAPRTGHAAVASENTIYIFGGIDVEGNRNNDLFSLDLSTMIWQKIDTLGNIPSQRSGAKAVYVQNKAQGEIIIFGGYINKDVLHCNDLYSYDIQKNTWSLINTNQEIVQKRTDHTMVEYNNFIYIFGGRGENKQIFRDLKRFNQVDKFWQDIKCEGAQIMPRFGHVAVTYEHFMYVFGGWDGQNCLDDLYQYSFETNIWYELRRYSGEKPFPRYRHDVLVYQSCMYIFGGVDQNQRRFNDLYEFEFTKRNWTKILTSGCLPSARTFHKIVNSQNLIFLLGGFDGERRNDLHLLKVDPIQSKIVSRISTLSDFEFQQFDKPMNFEQLKIDLNEQIIEISKKIQKEEDKKLCKICFAREIDTVIMSCSHFILCFKCAIELFNKSGHQLKQNIQNIYSIDKTDENIKCPLCRSQINSIIQTFLST